MYYDYKCEQCEHITVINQSIKLELPKSIKCEKCKGNSTYDWKQVTDNIIIPDKFKATSDYIPMKFNKLEKKTFY